MSFLDNLRASVTTFAQTNPITRLLSDLSNVTKPQQRSVQSAISEVVDRNKEKITTGLPEAYQNYQQVNRQMEDIKVSPLASIAARGNINKPLSELGRRFIEDSLRGTARLGVSTALTSINRKVGSDLSIPSNRFSREFFGGGYTGEAPGEVFDITTQLKRAREGQGILGSVTKFGEEKLRVPAKYSAPIGLIGLGLADINPLPSDPGDAAKIAKVGSRLIDTANGLLKNITLGEQILNQADILPELAKKAGKIDDLSRIIRRADSTIRIMPEKQVTNYLSKNSGSQLIGSVADAARSLGIENAKTYADEAAVFMKDKKIGRGFVNSRARGGLTEEAANTLQAKPFKPMNIAENLKVSASENPLESASTQPLDTLEDMQRAVADVSALRKIGSAESDRALETLTQRIEASGLRTKYGQGFRALQEIYARDKNALVEEASYLYRKANETLKKAGKAEIVLDDATKADLKYLEDLLRAAEPGSLRARNILAEANKLISKGIPLDASKALGSWFRSSILSSPATGVTNLVGTFAPEAVEVPARALQRTIGNVITKGLLGVKGSGSYDALKAAKSGKEALSYVFQDLAKGSNTFGDFTEGVGIGATVFQRPEKIRSAKDAALTIADYTERGSRFLTSASDIPAREASIVAKVDEISGLYKAAGVDITDQKIRLGINERAIAEADFRFLINDGKLAQAFRGLHGVIKKLGDSTNNKTAKSIADFFASATLPFVTVPPNLIARGVVDYSPLGFLKAGNSLIKAVLMPKNAANIVERINLARDLQQQTSRAAAGSSLAAGVAFLGGELGVMTFGRPTNSKEADLQIAQKIPAYGINISGVARAYETFFSASIAGSNPKEAWEAAKEAARTPGENDQWIGYDSVQPIAITVATIGKLMEENKKNPNSTFIENLPAAMNAAGQSILGRPIFTNFKTLFSSNQDLFGAGANYLSNIAAGLLTPGWLSFIAQVTDQKDGQGVVRETYSGNVGESVLNRIANRVPGLRQTLKQAVDIGGNPVVSKNPFLSALGRDLAPQAENLPPTAKAGLALQDITGETTAIPTRIDKKGSRYDVPFTLSTDELTWARTTYGKATQAELERLLKDPKFLAKNPTQQTSAISDAYSDVKATLDSYFVAKALGVSDQLPWYAWNGVFKKMNEYKNSSGGALFTNLDGVKKKQAIEAYLQSLKK